MVLNRGTAVYVTVILALVKRLELSEHESFFVFWGFFFLFSIPASATAMM